jgi:hypothetical protein
MTKFPESQPEKSAREIVREMEERMEPHRRRVLEAAANMQRLDELRRAELRRRRRWFFF